MPSLTLILIVLAALIIAVLAGYAVYLLRKVREQEKLQQQEEAAAELQLRQHQEELVKDIRFIARSVLQDQCDISEGVLRLEYLLRGLDADVWQRHELSTLREHHNDIRDMPILDAYRALTPKQQFALDKKRFQLEEANKPAIERELHWLVEYRFPQVTLLQ